MSQNERSQRPRSTKPNRIDDLLYVIALAMARRQMRLAWAAKHRDVSAMA